MGRRLQRNLGPVRALTPGQWTFSDRDRIPTISCPACGAISEVDDIFGSGVVRYRWACPVESCSFRDYLSLDDFDRYVPR